MKFTDGFWQMRPGVEPLYARQAYRVDAAERSVRVLAPTKVVERRADTLNLPALTATLTSPADGVIRVRMARHEGAADGLRFPVAGGADAGAATATDDGGATLAAGPLTARVAPGAPFDVAFELDGQCITGLGDKALAHMSVVPGTSVDVGPHDAPRVAAYSVAQLDLGVGELIYGLGERFGPLVKNGQTVDIWNADGGTSSEQSYKNIPFYLSSRGYGVFVNHPGHVSFEVGSESVQRVQFSVPGESVEFYVIAGPTPAEVLDRYTALTGRPAVVPAWSYGLWLSTSFTTDYDEATVASFVDQMAQRELPLSVFHFDCFWMREFRWTDLEWDPDVFPDPEGMLARLRERGLKVCVWINPYIAQESALFAEAADAGYLLRRDDGSVWQWDLWQAGMALVDFTNPDAAAWFRGKLRALLGQGVDALKSDFGERIPASGVAWHDDSDPALMHNYYARLYNEAVFGALEDERGAGDAVVFARSATAGGQSMPVHWGGDSTSTFESMAETLRGGLSLAASGFAYWSHDIGGFEGKPDDAIFKRWTAFGLLGSHSRFHGSTSYRVPWEFGDEAVDVTRVFARLKNRLMPYLYQLGLDAARTGSPLMRPMAFEFPDDPACGHLDRQYMLGPSLLVAPVFTAAGEVDFYLPPGTWTDWWTGEAVEGGGWRRERHGFLTVPLYVRPGAVLPVGAREDRPDYDYLDGLTIEAYPGAGGEITVTEPGGRAATFHVDGAAGAARSADAESGWAVRRGRTGPEFLAKSGAAQVTE